jgi:rhamnulokinase
VHIVSGGSRNRLLNQFVANATGLPVLAGPEEATAAGNLMVQALGLGIVGSLREAMPVIKKTFPIKRYVPDDSEVWSKAYARFQVATRSNAHGQR